MSLLAQHPTPTSGLDALWYALAGLITLVTVVLAAKWNDMKVKQHIANAFGKVRTPEGKVETPTVAKVYAAVNGDGLGKQLKEFGSDFRRVKEVVTEVQHAQQIHDRSDNIRFGAIMREMGIPDPMAHHAGEKETDVN